MDAYSINKRLIRLYGRDPILDLPKWRIIRSETQVEKQSGTHNIFYGDIYLRTETGVKEVMKYHYLKACWILEKLCIIHTKQEFSFIEKSHSYEPLYTFLDKNDKPLPLAWRPIEVIIGHFKLAEKRIQRTESDDYALEEIKLKKEQEKIKDILFGNDSNISSALEYKEGIVVPSSYKSEPKLIGDSK